MTTAAAVFWGTINSAFSILALLWVLPIGAVIYLDIKMVYYGIRKDGWRKLAGLIISFVLSLGALGWGLWSVITDFSLSLLFVAMGGAILLLFSVSSLLLDKDDIRHER